MGMMTWWRHQWPSLCTTFSMWKLLWTRSSNLSTLFIKKVRNIKNGNQLAYFYSYYFWRSVLQAVIIKLAVSGYIQNIPLHWCVDSMFLEDGSGYSWYSNIAKTCITNCWMKDNIISCWDRRCWLICSIGFSSKLLIDTSSTNIRYLSSLHC